MSADAGDPSDVAGAIAGRLAADAEVEYVDEGSFDIDASKGLAKLGQYQLAEPGAWILRVIEAGVRAGADRIEVDTKLVGVDLEFERAAGPIVLPGVVLERLLSVLVSTRAIPAGPVDREVLVQLAIGVNALLQRGVSSVRVESVDGEGRGARLICEDGEQRVEAVEAGRPGLRFEASWSAVDGDLRSMLGLGHEGRLLQERCHWASVRLVVDGWTIGKGLVLPQAKPTAPILDPAGAKIGIVGIGPDIASPARVLLLSAGVAIESLALPELQPGIVGVVEAGELRRDLSRSTFLREPELEALRQRVLAVAAALPRVRPSMLARWRARSRSSPSVGVRNFGLGAFGMGTAAYILGAATMSEAAVALGFMGGLVGLVATLIGQAKVAHERQQATQRSRAAGPALGHGMHQPHALPPAHDPGPGPAPGVQRRPDPQARSGHEPPPRGPG